MFKAGISSVANRAPAQGTTFKPQLTSLVDVMTILLVFLIKSFSVEGSLVTPSPDLELPFSTSNKPPRPICTIEITRNAVIADGNILAKIEQFAGADSMNIPVLHDWMRLQADKCRDTVKIREVLIQADKNTEFNVIKRVMFTCSKAGFTDYSVLVLGDD
jgi:biopolymer transport protein ExbD